MGSRRPRPHKKRFLHLCTIGKDFAEKLPEDETLKTKLSLVRRIVRLARAADQNSFEHHCGDGYHGWFEENEGKTKMGYRIDQRRAQHELFLDIALCHIYPKDIITTRTPHYLDKTK